MWNDVELLDSRFGEGDAVRVLGRVERYRDRLQLDVRTIESARTSTPRRGTGDAPRRGRARRLPRGPRRRDRAPRPEDDRAAHSRRRGDPPAHARASRGPRRAPRLRGRPARARRVRPTSCRSAAASRRSARRRGWSWQSSRQIVATPTVCSSRPPAYVVMAVRRGRAARASVGGSPGRRGSRHGRLQARVGDLGGEELEEAVELVGVAAHRRREARPGRCPGRLDRAHVELKPVAVALDPAEHAHRVALAEARVEQVDVVPDARLDAPARIDELEREVRASRSSSAAAACARPRRRPRRRGPRPARRSCSRRRV